MSTRKFVSIVVSALIVFVVVISSVGFAVAEEDVRSVAAVVTGYKNSFGDLEIEVVDAEGNIWAYYADEAHIGDLIILTIIDFGDPSFEDDEIIDVVTVARLNDKEMIQWLNH